MCPQDASGETEAISADVTRLTRRQAEKVAGVSRATLARYVADGTLSVQKDSQGHNVYDAAELARVFSETFSLSRLETPVSQDGVCPPETGKIQGRDSAVSAVLHVEKRYLTEERDRLRQEVDRLRRELEEEREKRETERSGFMDLLRQNQDTVKQLTDQREKAEQHFRLSQQTVPAKRRGFWGRLRGE